MKRVFARSLGLLAAGLGMHAVAPAADGAAEVAQGAYLVKSGGCSDCHTPWKMGPKGPEPDGSRGLSGHPQGMMLPPAPAGQGPWIWGGAATNTAFWGPWGISYASNLTPDVETGIGAWTVEQFIGAMRKGQHLGNGRPILPPMPWQPFGMKNDADLKAIFAYLKSQSAVKNAVPANQAPTQPTATPR